MVGTIKMSMKQSFKNNNGETVEFYRIFVEVTNASNEAVIFTVNKARDYEAGAVVTVDIKSSKDFKPYVVIE